MTGQLGELTENAFADLIALPCRGEPGDLFEAIVQHQGPVTASMISGTWALPPQTT